MLTGHPSQVGISSPPSSYAQGGCQSTEDGYRLAEELGTISHTRQTNGALGRYSRVRVLRTAIVQGVAQLGSDLLVSPLSVPLFTWKHRLLDPLQKDLPPALTRQMVP